MGVLLAAWSAAAGQVSVGTSGRTPDGRGVVIGVIEEDPRKALQREQAVCHEKIGAAEAAMARQRWGTALEELEGALEYSPSPAQFQRIRQLYEALEAEGQRQLTAVDELVRQRKYEEAMDQYRRIVREFIPLPSALKARATLGQLRNDPAVRRVIQQGQAEKMIRELQAILTAELAIEPLSATSRPADAADKKPGAATRRFQGVKDLSAEGQDRAMDLLERIVSRCPDCPAGQSAAKELAALKADKQFYEEFLARRQARQAETILRLAQGLRQAGRLDKALLYYRKVLTDFPKTPAAQRAQMEAAEVEGMLTAEKPTPPADAPK
jgi:tetratricopeptide (TPR) repeat protein